MNNLYERIFSLCSENGIKPGKMCTDLGISRGNISDLKMGRIESLSADKLAKIATYFKVSVDYLLTGEETKKAPTQEGERDHAIDHIDDELKEYLDELRSRSEMRMLFSTTKNATKTQIEAIVKMIEEMQGEK